MLQHHRPSTRLLFLFCGLGLDSTNRSSKIYFSQDRSVSNGNANAIQDSFKIQPQLQQNYCENVTATLTSTKNGF